MAKCCFRASALADDRMSAEEHITYREFGHPRDHSMVLGQRPVTIISQPCGCPKSASEFIPGYDPRTGWHWRYLRGYS